VETSNFSRAFGCGGCRVVFVPGLEENQREREKSDVLRQDGHSLFRQRASDTDGTIHPGDKTGQESFDQENLPSMGSLLN